MIADVVVVLTAFLAGGALVALVQHLRSLGTWLDLDRLRRERDAAQRAADRRFDLLYDVATALDVDVPTYRAATGLGQAYNVIDSAEMLAGACRWQNFFVLRSRRYSARIAATQRARTARTGCALLAYYRPARTSHESKTSR